MSGFNPFSFFESRVTHTAKVLNLNERIIAKLLTPDRVIEREISLETSRGMRTFKAYRVQFSNARGPYKGGIRFHPGADLKEVMALAGGMALKCAAVGIPLGGGKGGVAFDPKEYTKADLEKISRAWIQVMAPFLGADKDIPAPDVYTNPEIMAVMLDEYEKIVGKSEPAMITGKPLPLGGSEGRGTATAVGGMYVLIELLTALSKQPEGMRVAVQGFGNAGAHIAKLLFKKGMKIVGISDSSGGIYDPLGIDPEEAEAHKKEFGSLEAVYRHKKAEGKVSFLSNAQFLECDTDILIPAALDNQLTKDNASRIKAHIILELANGPTAPEADQIFNERKIYVIPDILANAGGVTVSYFEWVQNRSGYYWTEEEVFARLQPIMRRAFHEGWKLSTQKDSTLRDAVYMLAVKRIADALTARGV